MRAWEKYRPADDIKRRKKENVSLWWRPPSPMIRQPGGQQMHVISAVIVEQNGRQHRNGRQRKWRGCCGSASNQVTANIDGFTVQPRSDVEPQPSDFPPAGPTPGICNVRVH